MDYYSNKQDKLDFKQIALGHYKKILDISSQEFRGGYNTSVIDSKGQVLTSYVTNKRVEYNQSVEMFALALFPYFDQLMMKRYNFYMKKINEVKEVAKQQLQSLSKNSDKGTSTIRAELSKKELSYYKKMFRELSCLMHRLDYFKTSSYEEGDTDLYDIDGSKEESEK